MLSSSMYSLNNISFTSPFPFSFPFSSLFISTLDFLFSSSFDFLFPLTFVIFIVISSSSFSFSFSRDLSIIIWSMIWISFSCLLSDSIFISSIYSICKGNLWLGLIEIESLSSTDNVIGDEVLGAGDFIFGCSSFLGCSSFNISIWSINWISFSGFSSPEMTNSSIYSTWEGCFSSEGILSSSLSEIFNCFPLFWLMILWSTIIVK